MRWLAVATVIACSTPPAVAPSATSTGNGLAGVRDALDAKRDCADRCCLPQPAWFGGGVIDPADLSRARAALGDGRDPRVLGLALRIVSSAAELADVTALERWLDDARAAGQLPTVEIGQRMMRCDRARWEPTTVSGEALRGLSRAFATPFESAGAYRKYAALHPDPTKTFDYWYAQLRTRRPPEPKVLAGLRGQAPVLVARVLAAYCDDTCGLTDSELDEVLRRGVGNRGVAWLARTETVPEWERAEIFEAVARTLLRRGEALFDAGQLAGLDALLHGATLAPHLQAQLAVLLGRLRPTDAIAIWTTALVTLRGVRGVVLAEAAEREPIAFADTLAQYFDGVNATSILDGLARAGARAAPTFKRLAAKLPFTVYDVEAVVAFAAAARAVGCSQVGDPSLLRPHPKKGGNAIGVRKAQRAAVVARELALKDVAACVAQLP